MTTPTDWRAMCAELLNDLEHSLFQHCLEGEIDNCPLIIRARALLAQPEPEGLTDCITYRELNDLCKEHFPMDEDGIDSLHGLVEAAIAADRARRPTPQPPVDGEVAEVLQWPAEWSRKQRAQEAEMLCCSAGMTPGKEMQQIVEDARDGMPLQHLHDLISHAIPTPQAPADGEVEETPNNDDAWFHELVSEISRVQHVALGEGQGPRFDLAEAVARWCRPTPQPPADGEVAELIELMRNEAGCYDSRTDVRHGMFTHAADLLERLTNDNAGLVAAADSLWADNISLLDNEEGR